MMDSSTTAENLEPQVIFRPSKRRKQFRQRAEEDDNTKGDDATSQTVAPSSTAESVDVNGKEPQDDKNSETEGLSVVEVLRLRNARRSKLKGVEFRPEGPHKDEAVAGPSSATKDDVNEALELGMSRRFAPQAGLVGELVNRHMYVLLDLPLQCPGQG